MVQESAVTRGLTRIVTAETSDPRPPQTLFLVPVAALLAVVAAVEPAQLGALGFLAGLVMVVLASAAAFLVPWSRLEPMAVVMVPLLDLAAIASMRLGSEAGAVATLAVFPAIWLGLVYRRHGVVIATVATLLALTLPGLLLFGSGLEGWLQAVLLPIITGVVAYSTFLTADVWSAHRSGLEEQRAVLERLLRQVTRHRQLTTAIVETVDVGLLAIGADGSYESMNPTHARFLRLAYPDGHGGTAGETGHAFAADGTTRLRAAELPSSRAVRGEAFSDLTIWVGRDRLARRALAVSSRPMYDEGGTFTGAVLAYKDITDLMQALRVKDEFVASVSHELRTPLTSIRGYIDLVVDEPDDLPDHVVRHLSVARRNAERLELLVSDLLSTAQLESGVLRMKPEPLDLAAVVDQCLAAAGSSALEARVRFAADVGSVPVVRADPARIAQVVDNLLSNAVKYTLPGGEVRVCLTAEAEEVLLEIRDTGIGMAAEDLGRLFTKFFRAQTAHERAIPGVGLGMVITKAIVEAHDGAIEVDSAEGVGTTVRVRLPLAAA